MYDFVQIVVVNLAFLFKNKNSTNLLLKKSPFENDNGKNHRFDVRV
jgi:hypothetical protein